MTQKIILTKGLPASGKTTWSKQFIAERNTDYGEYWKRVNKDDLRAMLDNSVWGNKAEKIIIDLRDNIIAMLLARGCSIVIDDTNLNPIHEKHIRDTFEGDLVKDKVVVEIKDFTEVPLEKCLERDRHRPNYVGEAAIKKMWRLYLRPKVEKPKFIEGLPTAIICDLDGTLALFGDADPYNRDFSQDEVNPPVESIVMRNEADEVILCSGRMDKYRKQTEDWLKKNQIDYDKLYMRKTDDQRKDFVIKEEIYNTYIKDKYNVLFVLDDRNQVVDLWRHLGLTCFQVAEGDF